MDVPARKRSGELKLFTVGMVFVVTFAAARLVLAMATLPVPVKVVVALVPVPVFVLLVMAFYRAIGSLDEFQRLIQLKALAFAFPASPGADPDPGAPGKGDHAAARGPELPARVDDDAHLLLSGPVDRAVDVPVKGGGHDGNRRMRCLSEGNTP